MAVQDRRRVRLITSSTSVSFGRKRFPLNVKDTSCNLTAAQVGIVHRSARLGVPVVAAPRHQVPLDALQ